MAKIIDITKYGNSNKRKRKHMMSPKIRFGFTALGFSTILIICMLALLYLVQANKTATYGYEIDKWDERIKELEKEKEKQELEAAKLRSTNRIKQELEKINMMDVDPTKIAYYKYNQKEMASKNNK